MSVASAAAKEESVRSGRSLLHFVIGLRWGMKAEEQRLVLSLLEPNRRNCLNYLEL